MVHPPISINILLLPAAAGRYLTDPNPSSITSTLWIFINLVCTFPFSFIYSNTNVLSLSLFINSSFVSLWLIGVPITKFISDAVVDLAIADNSNGMKSFLLLFSSMSYEPLPI